MSAVIQPVDEPMLEEKFRLAAFVAERVMGWKRRLTEANREQSVLVPPGWREFSAVFWLGMHVDHLALRFVENDSDALEVFKYLAEGCVRDLRCWRIGYSDEDGWSCTWERDTDGARAPTLALAICRAAAKAAGTS